MAILTERRIILDDNTTSVDRLRRELTGLDSIGRVLESTIWFGINSDQTRDSAIILVENPRLLDDVD